MNRSFSLKTPSSEDLQEEDEDDSREEKQKYSYNHITHENKENFIIQDNNSVTTEDWSPTGNPNEAFKEQYMFLGNLYTVTRPRIQTPNSPVLLEVSTPAVTQEDLHYLENESKGVNIIENGLPASHFKFEKSLGSEGFDADDFWMDLEISNEGKEARNKKSPPKRRKSLPSDIVKAGILPLRTVLE